METNQFIQFRLNYDDLVRDYTKLFDSLHINESSPEHVVMVEILNRLKNRLSNNREITGGYKVFRVEEMEDRSGYVRIENECLHIGRKIASLLKGVTYVALFVCTAGKLFSELTDEFVATRDLLEAYTTDVLGSLTVELAMDKIHDTLESRMKREGWGISNRYSPGYCDWPLEDQKIIFSLLGKEQRNVYLSDSSLMIPMKSVSGIIGIGENLKKKDYECDICHFPNCSYRRLRKR